jgi:hypothetical protein
MVTSYESPSPRFAIIGNPCPLAYEILTKESAEGGNSIQDFKYRESMGSKTQFKKIKNTYINIAVITVKLIQE